jgi:short-subunit dehydrogenase
MSAEAPRPLALITGASSGIGARVAERLAARGMRTLLVARRIERLDELAARLSVHAPSVAVELDLSRADAVEPEIARLLREHGPADVVVNNAGYGRYGRFLEHEPADHRRLMEVNYFAAVAVIRAVLPAMMSRRRGHVINIASMSTKMGPWGHAGYAAAKAALVSLTQTLAAEHHGEGVHFSYVNPGIVDTEYFDELKALAERVRRWKISPDVAADRIVGLLDAPRLELCIPGHYRFLDVLKALHPALAHGIVRRQSRPRDDG